MPKRVQYTGEFPRQLDIPAKVSQGRDNEGKETFREVERTKEGALHLVPGRVHVLTSDEHKLAKTNYGLGKELRVLGDIPVPHAERNKAAKGSVPAANVPDLVEGSSPDDSPSNGSPKKKKKKTPASSS